MKSSSNVQTMRRSLASSQVFLHLRDTPIRRVLPALGDGLCGAKATTIVGRLGNRGYSMSLWRCVGDLQLQIPNSRVGVVLCL